LFDHRADGRLIFRINDKAIATLTDMIKQNGFPNPTAAIR